jgi:hypothetical protein
VDQKSPLEGEEGAAPWGTLKPALPDADAVVISLSFAVTSPVLSVSFVTPLTRSKNAADALH